MHFDRSRLLVMVLWGCDGDCPLDNVCFLFERELEEVPHTG